MTRAEIKAQAKASLKGNWGIAIGSIIVAGLIISVSSIVAIILMGVMAVGMAIVFTNIYNQTGAKFENTFDGFKNFVPNFLAGLLSTIYIGLWSMLFCIPGLVKSYSYAMTYYILADNPGMSANDAITASRKMMDGHKMELFVLDLSFIGWHILCSLTFGILYLYVAPYMAATRAGFYANLKAQQAVSAAEAPAAEAPAAE